MRIRQSMRRTHRRSRAEGVNWLSFSDLMSSLLLIFILIMFYIMYQYFDMYEVNMAEIARQQFDLDQANASLDEKTAKLTLAEQQMIAQQIKLDAAQKDLTAAEDVLATQREELQSAQSLLGEKEQEIARQQASLDALSVQLTDQQAQILVQQQTLNDQQTTMDQQRQALAAQQVTLDSQQQKLNEQQTTMDQQRQALEAQQITLDQAQATVNAQQSRLDQAQATVDAQQSRLDQAQATMNAQQSRLEEQQQTLEQQQAQIEQLIGLRPRIISSLSEALRSAHVSAQVDPSNGSIALESNMLFETNKYELTDTGKAFIDRFLPVYLDVLLGDDYRQYVSEIIIEGHTDSQGDYITNLKLSQQRALAVASYVLADDYNKISREKKRLLRSLATANGRSWSDLVRDADGNEDMDASRRVVFKFRMTDEQMIRQLKDIMEQSE